MIRFCVLGPVRVRRDGQSIELPAVLRRSLALLLCREGSPLPAEVLAEQLWEGRPPPAARKTVQVYMHRLRRALRDERRIRHSADGYWLELHPGEFDARAFRELVAAGQAALAARDPAPAYERFSNALEMWADDAYADVVGMAAIDAERGRLRDLRLTTVEAWAAAGLDLGLSGELIEPLTRAARENPYRERLSAHLMLALYRRGRQEEAQRHYLRTRQRLVEELGLEPSASLVRLHEQIDSRDPALNRKLPHRFLPPDVPNFVGRQADLEWLDAMARSGSPVVISAIAGTPGIGKTALAVRWAHRAAHRFPDGQLYVNLRGYDTGPPMRPLDAVGHLLRCMQVPPEEVPATLQEATARYRAMLSGKRVLVVADNARSVEQVRPLLPRGAERAACLVVTSRDRLAGLVSAEGARRLTLDRLSDADSLTLLRQIAGNQRVRPEARGVEELLGLCGGLPLVLRIVAAHLVDHPEDGIPEYLAGLDRRGRLDALAVEGDDGHGLRAVLDRSYEDLPPAAQRVLCLLSMIPGFGFAPPSVAAMAGVTEAEAASILDRLAGAHLVEEPRPGRHSLHDLIGEYARARLGGHEGHEDCLGRLLDHLLGKARKAISLMVSGRPYSEEDSDPAPEICSAATAMAWLDAEYRNLAAAMLAAIPAGLIDFALGVAAPLWRYFNYSQRHSEWIATFEVAVAAMPSGHAKYQLLTVLGGAYATVGRFEEAIATLEESVSGHLASGDQAAAARAGINLAMTFERQGRYAEALPRAEAVLEMCRRLGEHSLQMLLLGGNLPVLLNKMGRHEEARDRVLEGMDLAERVGTPFDHLRARHHLGDTYVLLGRPDLALPELDEALSLSRWLGDARMEALTLGALGVAHRELGDLESAITLITQGEGMIQQPSLACELANTLGATHLRAGNYGEARVVFGRALELATRIGSRHERAKALVGLGKLELHGSPEAGRRRLAEALATLDSLAPDEAAEVRLLLSTS